MLGFFKNKSKGKVICSPCNGRVVPITGLDTVILKGAPFTSHISVGDQVKKGDLLMEADLEQIKAADLNVITPVLIGNTADYSEIKMLKEGNVSAGDEILSLA